MSGNIRAGNFQRTGEYPTRGVPILHGVRWQLPLCVEEGIDPEEFHPVSLLQQDGVIYITYYTRNYVGGDEESGCCALDAHSGTLRWRFTVADRFDDLTDNLLEVPPEYRSPGSVSSMVLTATTAFVGTTYGVVYGLDLSSGQPTWKMDIDDLKAQLGEDAFEGASMNMTWQDDYGLNVLAVIGNLLLMSVESEAQGICGIDIAKRTCQWHTFGLNDGPLTLWNQVLYGRDMATQNGSYIYSAFDWHRQLSVWHSYCGDTDFEGNALEEEGTIPHRDFDGWMSSSFPEDAVCGRTEGEP